jgi:hypothetical protein
MDDHHQFSFFFLVVSGLEPGMQIRRATEEEEV